MKTINKLKDKPVSEILKEAGLINSSQLKVALMEIDLYPDLELEEILLLHGWLRQKTVDFFVGMFDKAYFDQTLVIGQLFYESGLLSQQEIEYITRKQQKMGIDFGSVAVLKGFIKQETLDFFTKYFISEPNSKTISQSKKTIFQILETKERDKRSQKYVSSPKNRNSIAEQNKDDYSFNTIVKQIKTKNQGKNIISSYEELTEEGLEDIPWID